MKKLVLTIAVFALAFAANAAATDWKFTSAAMKGADLTSAYSGDVAIWAVGGDLAEATLVTTLSTTTGTISNKSFSSDLFTADTTYNFYYVLTGTKDGVEYTLTSAQKSVTAVTVGSGTIGFGNQASFTSNASNWTAAAVPEPTSGLLLLLGVAGLALRRKQK